MTTDEMMTIARDVAAGGKLPNKPMLREFMAALVGAPAATEHADDAAPEHVASTDHAWAERDYLVAERDEALARAERAEAALHALPHEFDALAATAAAMPKLDPAALLGLTDFDRALSPATIERTSTGNLLIVGLPQQITPDEGRALARDLLRAGA